MALSRRTEQSDRSDDGPVRQHQISGNYGNMTEVSYQVAKRAARKVLSITTSPASGRNVVIT